MINLSKAVWVEKSLDAVPAVSASFRLVKYKEYTIIADTPGEAIVNGAEEGKEALAIISRSIKDIQGIEVKEGKAATYKDVLEHGTLTLVAAFLKTFLDVQQDQDFLTK
jgi:hypothetical protein